MVAGQGATAAPAQLRLELGVDVDPTDGFGPLRGEPRVELAKQQRYAVHDRVLRATGTAQAGPVGDRQLDVQGPVLCVAAGWADEIRAGHLGGQPPTITFGLPRIRFPTPPQWVVMSPRRCAGMLLM